MFSKLRKEELISQQFAPLPLTQKEKQKEGKARKVWHTKDEPKF